MKRGVYAPSYISLSALHQFFYHQRFEQSPALVLATQTVDVFARDGCEDDALALLIHLNVNPRPSFDAERVSDG